MYLLPNETGCHDCSRSNSNSNNNDDRRIGTSNNNEASIASRGEVAQETQRSNSRALVSLLGFGYENHSRPHANAMGRAGLTDIYYHPALSYHQEPSCSYDISVDGSNMHLVSPVPHQPSSASGTIISSSDHLVAILDEALDILSDLPTNEEDRDIYGHPAIIALARPSFEQQ